MHFGRFAKRRDFRVERQFEGIVFDVGEARRFARVTALWWGVDPRPVECLVEELARRAVCAVEPAFTVALRLVGEDVRVCVEATPGALGHPPASADHVGRRR